MHTNNRIYKVHKKNCIFFTLSIHFHPIVTLLTISKAIIC